MPLSDAALEMIHALRGRMATLTGKSEQRQAYIMYQLRLLDLLEAALSMQHQGAGVPSCILMRSALECLVDCANIHDNPKYIYILRAILLENRYSIFRYKTPPLYESLIEGHTNGEVRDMTKDAQDEFRSCLKEATKHFPALQNNPRNLSVIMRFRLANMKDRYYSTYTWLSMQAHNDLEPVLLNSTMQNGSSTLHFAQGALLQSAIIHFSLEMLLDSCRYIRSLFGPQNDLIQHFIQLLEKYTQSEEADG